MSSVLVATLGVEPQIIPLATALLLAREPLAAVVVLHTAAHSNQLNSIYSKLESVFGLSPDVGLKREFLRRELGGSAKEDRS